MKKLVLVLIIIISTLIMNGCTNDYLVAEYNDKQVDSAVVMHIVDELRSCDIPFTVNNNGNIIDESYFTERESELMLEDTGTYSVNIFFNKDKSIHNVQLTSIRN